MKKEENIKHQESQRQLLMMLFANSQIAINLMDKLPGFEEVYKQSYKNLSNKYLNKNIELIKSFYVMMDKKKENKKYFEIAFNQTQDAIDVFMKAIQNQKLESVIYLLKALENGDIMQFDEGKHKKILKQLKPVEL